MEKSFFTVLDKNIPVCKGIWEGDERDLGGMTEMKACFEKNVSPKLRNTICITITFID